MDLLKVMMKLDIYNFLCPEQHNLIYNRIIYLINEKSGITGVINHILQEPESIHIVFYL